MSRSTINDLSKRTDQIFEALNDAERALKSNSCSTYNGFGILSDPSMARSNIYDAKKKLEEALALLNGAKWPSSNADWDALEAAHNR